ncbi:MAG: hypothetical protein K4H23_04610 [Mollicutes bacterium PWAP]|nr:hypothetical protein [Mollicutes bacterium PWAP]
MKKRNKLLLSLGSFFVAFTPMVAVVGCGSNLNNEFEKDSRSLYNEASQLNKSVDEYLKDLFFKFKEIELNNYSESFYEDELEQFQEINIEKLLSPTWIQKSINFNHYNNYNFNPNDSFHIKFELQETGKYFVSYYSELLKIKQKLLMFKEVENKENKENLLSLKSPFVLNQNSVLNFLPESIKTNILKHNFSNLDASQIYLVSYDKHETTDHDKTPYISHNSVWAYRNDNGIENLKNSKNLLEMNSNNFTQVVYGEKIKNIFSNPLTSMLNFEFRKKLWNFKIVKGRVI